MPQKRLSVRKIKEVLRLRFGLGLRQDQISSSCSIGQATVHRYLERAAAVGLSWPLPDDCDDQRLNELLFPARPIWPPVKLRPTADFAQIHSTHSNQRLEAASQRALQLQACSYSSLRSILKRSLDRQTTLDLESGKSGPRHENVRGAGYYDPPTTLLQ